MTFRVVRLGLFLAISFGISVAIGAKIQGTSFEDRYQLTATFDDVTQLFRGDPVKLAGARVGKVESIRLVDGKAEVGFTVRSTIQLPTDSSVAVRWRNLIAQRELYLDPGPNATAATEFLPTDGSGVVARTKSAVDVSVLVNAVGVLGETIDPHQLNTIFTAMAEALEGNGSSLDTIVRQLVGLVGVVADRSDTISQLVADLDSMTSVLARRDGQVQAMVDNIALLSQAFTDNTQLFLSVVDNLAEVAPTFDQLLSRNEQEFRNILDSVAGVVGALASKAPQLEQTLAGVPEGLESVFQIVREGPYVRLNLACLDFAQFPCDGLGGYWLPLYPLMSYGQVSG
ncbi:MAG: MCE family protein [Acidimicrobiales bacterium]